MVTIALVGCSKKKNVAKNGAWIPARELYSSDLFCKRVAYVERIGLPWYILSAGGGLISPSTPIRPYEKKVTDLTELEAAEWHVGIANQLFTELFYEFGEPRLSSVTVELHAGAKYCEPLGAILGMFGVQVVKPVAGMGIGKQLEFYKAVQQLAGVN